MKNVQIKVKFILDSSMKKFLKYSIHLEFFE